MRLDRVLVGRGVGSRRQVAQWVRRGAVCLDGEVVRDPALHIAESAVLTLHGEPVEAMPMMLCWHKPVGVLTTLRDPWGREGLDGVLPGYWSQHFHAVGRLDKDTSGLLLFSRDGKLTQHLLHPRRAVPRTYLVTVDVDPDPELPARLAAGVETSLGCFAGTVERIEGRVVQLVVREGKHRMVRRMMHNAGASVVALHRIRYGACELGELGEGQIRPVTDATLQALDTRAGRSA